MICLRVVEPYCGQARLELSRIDEPPISQALGPSSTGRNGLPLKLIL